jgi:SAM-dependent methyltransferase
VNTERLYYENDGFWNESALRPQDGERIAALAELIPAGVETVAELGCGNGLFANAIATGKRRYGRIAGLDRSRAALRYVRVPAVCASIDELPLGDRSFDLVAALEVFEHLPAAIFSAALSESCRISARYVMISVPNDQDLSAGLIACPSCRTMFHPDYHMRSFSRESLEHLLDAHGFRPVLVKPLGRYVRYRGVDRLRSRKRPAGNPFAVAIPCPVCGAELPAGERTEPMPATPPAKSSPIRSALKNLWPTVEEYTWLAGLYERTRA